MILFGLILVPLFFGLIGFFVSKGRITWKELIVHEVIVLLLIGVGYFIALKIRMTDVEIWNGVITKKWEDRQGCCHSYPCNCHEICSGSGTSQSCTTICQTCYEHSHDINWQAVTSNGEVAYYDGCNRPNSEPPDRWNQIVIGEPTAIEHSYVNYIKGNPDSIMRREGAAEKFKGFLPKYPRVYDHYRAKRFLAVGPGVDVDDLDALNNRLSEINGRLGAAKQVNIVVVVVNSSEQMYLEALREVWLGGKKNDFVVVIGAPAFPKISWAGVLSWTKIEDIRISVRNRILDLSSFDGNAILDIIDSEVKEKFVRRPMADFEYLKSTIKPPRWAVWLLLAASIVITLILQYYFYILDPFGDDYNRRRFGGFGRRSRF